MSLALRNSLRHVARAAPRASARSLSTTTESAALKQFLAEEKALQHHAAQTSDLWRKISYYVCVPAVVVCVAWVYNAEAEHKAHIEHIKHENGGELPETPSYDYLNRRSKPYPWGPNSLFFNPHVNKDLS